MTGTEFVRSAVDELHRAMLDDMRPLTKENLAWKPAPKANPIGFLFWHFMRTEDNNIQRLQGKPSIWESEGYHQNLGLDARAQGTGFTETDADRISRVPLDQMLAYAEKVVQSTSDFLKSLSDEQLDRVPDPNSPRRTIAVVLRSIILAHGWWHLGEIRYLKGMQGMPAAR